MSIYLKANTDAALRPILPGADLTYESSLLCGFRPLIFQRVSHEYRQDAVCTCDGVASVDELYAKRDSANADVRRNGA